jgi:RNA polymerase sigma-70 factor (ECF subfamily)
MMDPARSPQCPSVPVPPDAGRASFESMFREELGYVINSLKRLGVRESDAEDVAHDVFVVAYRKQADFDPGRPRRPWLFGIALRVASDYRRLARNRYERPSADPESAASSSDGVDVERRRIVQRGLDTLDLDKRAVLVLHDVEGHAMPEVADALGIPLNTAYSRLRAARERFRAAVTGHASEPGEGRSA